MPFETLKTLSKLNALNFDSLGISGTAPYIREGRFARPGQRARETCPTSIEFRPLCSIGHDLLPPSQGGAGGGWYHSQLNPAARSQVARLRPNTRANPHDRYGLPTGWCMTPCNQPCPRRGLSPLPTKRLRHRGLSARPCMVCFSRSTASFRRTRRHSVHTYPVRRQASPQMGHWSRTHLR